MRGYLLEPGYLGKVDVEGDADDNELLQLARVWHLGRQCFLLERHHLVHQLLHTTTHTSKINIIMAIQESHDPYTEKKLIWKRM